MLVGKTHTILGTAETPGIIPRCAADLFQAVKQQQLHNATSLFAISYSYLEIYKEKVLADCIIAVISLVDCSSYLFLII